MKNADILIDLSIQENWLINTIIISHKKRKLIKCDMKYLRNAVGVTRLGRERNDSIINRIDIGLCIAHFETQ